MFLEEKGAFRATNSLPTSSRLLVSSAHESIYRHSYSAELPRVPHWQVARRGSPCWPTGPRCAWRRSLPPGDKVAYVQDNNLWVVGLVADQRTRAVDFRWPLERGDQRRFGLGV